nr:immunoglobulin heavy chain junction region [Mus musculus]MBK4195044.1 immunoglobulin heavy chain junction region [Mus musculus]
CVRHGLLGAMDYW